MLTGKDSGTRVYVDDSRGQTTVRLPDIFHTNIVPKNTHLANVSDFICQEGNVFSQRGCNVRTVTPLAETCRSIRRIRGRVGFWWDIPKTPIGVLIYVKNCQFFVTLAKLFRISMREAIKLFRIFCGLVFLQLDKTGRQLT